MQGEIEDHTLGWASNVEVRKMSTKTIWTEQRLRRLFDRYNKTYWRGKLSHYAVRVRTLDDCVGICDYKSREILLNIDVHHDDRRIRATLLHEMTHVAAPKSGLDGHGYKFWAETERLLRQGAPIEVGMSETSGLRILADVVPRKFTLAHKAMGKAEAARQRPILRALKIRPAVQLTDDDTLRAFTAAATEMTERAAVLTVGIKYGLLDVEGKPKSGRAAAVIAKGRKAFRVSRSEFLQNNKQAFRLTRGDLLQIKKPQTTNLD
jgi:hypothetical protein